MLWMTLLLAVGTTARITRLISQDTIFFFLRDWLAATVEDAKASRKDPMRAGTKEWIFTFAEDMVACAWCLSVWVSAPVAAIAWLWGDSGWFVVPALALSASLVTGKLLTTGKD